MHLFFLFRGNVRISGGFQRAFRGFLGVRISESGEWIVTFGFDSPLGRVPVVLFFGFGSIRTFRLGCIR